MRDIGAALWLVLIVIGVVSSIVQSAKRARGGGAPPPARSAPPPARQIGVAPVVRPDIAPAPRGAATPPQIARLLDQFAAAAQAMAPAPPPPPAPAPRPSPPPQPVQRAAPPQQLLLRPQPRRLGLFEGRNAVVRAIIAAEVLGKPRALRDE